MAITVSDIVALFGAYYKPGGQNVKDLMTKFYQKSETDELFQLQVTSGTRLEKGKVSIGKVLQAFQKTFSPYGDTAFTGRKIDLYPLKIDVAEYPDTLTRTWAGFLTGEDIDRTKWPFIKYWLEQLVMNQAIEDWELDAVFGGVAGSVVEGTPLPAAEAVNGIRFLINTEINDSGYTDPIVLGAVPTDAVEFVEYMEAFAGAINRKYYSALQTVAMSKTLETRFKKGMRAKYNMNYSQADLATIIDTPLKVKGYASHEASDKVWTTVKGNAVLGIRKPQNQTAFEVEKIDRKVKAYTDFDKGLGFWDPTLIFTNDTDLDD